MTRINIRGDDRGVRLFDILVMDDLKTIYIESKKPRENPVRISLSDLVHQINEGVGEKIIIVQATEP